MGSVNTEQHDMVCYDYFVVVNEVYMGTVNYSNKQVRKLEKVLKSFGDLL